VKKTWVIKISDVPANSTIEKFILSNTDILDQIQNFDPHIYSHEKTVKFSFKFNELIADTEEAIQRFGVFPFHYKEGTKVFSSYLSSSLTWNPKAIDSVSADPHRSTLGSSHYQSGNSDFYEKIDALKNSYADSYGFLERTPLANFKSIKTLLDSFERTLIRSRLSVLKAESEESTKLNYLWHKDESIFLNLRINIPVISNENYVIQYIDASEEIKEFQLQPGKAYCYNTQLLHRPFCKNLNSSDRINIICGISPWFDYCPDSKTWSSNEHYGVTHPFDMLKNQCISPYFGESNDK
jgi:hypothetical protein